MEAVTSSKLRYPLTRLHGVITEDNILAVLETSELKRLLLRLKTSGGGGVGGGDARQRGEHPNIKRDSTSAYQHWKSFAPVGSATHHKTRIGGLMVKNENCTRGI